MIQLGPPPCADGHDWTNGFGTIYCPACGTTDAEDAAEGRSDVVETGDVLGVAVPASHSTRGMKT